MNIPIPSEAIEEDRLAFVGTSGSGKTYNASLFVEYLLSTGARVVVVDPLDVWWGLRIAKDGDGAGFDIPIFGGSRADLPLNERTGKIIGEALARSQGSAIVSLADLPSKEAERRFMVDFLETLYRKANGEPLHIVFDEADLFAPQGAGSGMGPKLQSLMEQIVRRGRVKGFVPWLITQRPAVISKDVLSQADGLVAFKLTSSHDRKAIGEWVRGQADTERWNEIWGDMPTMTKGRGLVWLPARDILETVNFPEKATFDSSATPKRGKKRPGKKLAPIDLGALKSQMENVEEEIKANDPAAIKKELRTTKAELSRAIIRAEQAEKKVVDAKPADTGSIWRAGHAAGFKACQDAVTAAMREVVPPEEAPRRVEGHAGPSSAAAKPAPPPPAAPVSQGELPGPQQRIVDALKWWEKFGIAAPSNEQTAFIAEYSPRSSGYTNPRGALNSAGLVHYPTPGHVQLTDAGRALAANYPSTPTIEHLHTAVLDKLSGPQRRILTPLLKCYPGALPNEELADHAGYSHTSSGYTNPRGALKSLGAVTYPVPGEVRASDWLFAK